MRLLRETWYRDNQKTIVIPLHHIRSECGDLNHHIQRAPACRIQSDIIAALGEDRFRIWNPGADQKSHYNQGLRRKILKACIRRLSR